MSNKSIFHYTFFFFNKNHTPALPLLLINEPPLGFSFLSSEINQTYLFTSLSRAHNETEREQGQWTRKISNTFCTLLDRWCFILFSFFPSVFYFIYRYLAYFFTFDLLFLVYSLGQLYVLMGRCVDFVAGWFFILFCTCFIIYSAYLLLACLWVWVYGQITCKYSMCVIRLVDWFMNF